MQLATLSSGLKLILRGIGLATLVLLASAGVVYADDTLPSGDPIASVTEAVDSTVDLVAEGSETTVALATETVEPVVEQAAEVLSPTLDPVVKVLRPVVEPVLDVVEPVVEPVVDLVNPITDVVVLASEPGLDVAQPVTGLEAEPVVPVPPPAAGMIPPRPLSRAFAVADLAATVTPEPAGNERFGPSAPLAPGAPLRRTPFSLPPPGVWAGVSQIGGAAMALLGAGLLAMLLGARWRLWSPAFIPRGRSLLPLIPPA